MSLKPIRETVEVAAELGRYLPEVDILAHLQRMANEVQSLVPDCVGMSVALLDKDVTFTLVATDEEIATLDAVQYLAGGPCVDAVESQRGLEVTEGDLLDEDTWRMFAQATSARAVKTTLTLLLTKGGHVVGSVNLYAASDHAFEGHHEELARIVGASESLGVVNADLSFRTRQVAEESPARVEASTTIDIATGMLAEMMQVDVAEAAVRLEDAARRAGISAERFAAALMKLHSH